VRTGESKQGGGGGAFEVVGSGGAFEGEGTETGELMAGVARWVPYSGVLGWGGDRAEGRG
jgi:hypothetical protein